MPFLHNVSSSNLNESGVHIHQFKSGYAKHVGEGKLYGEGRHSRFRTAQGNYYSDMGKLNREKESELMYEAKKRKTAEATSTRQHWWDIW